MLSELSWEEFVEHQAFASIEPFEAAKLDWQFASVCATVMNAVAGAVGSRKKFELKKFVLDWGGAKANETKKPMAWQDMKRLAKMFTVAFNEPEKPKGRKRHGRAN